jgi:succinate dehydrogenase / fumarate reductase cytochrome b subunit
MATSIIHRATGVALSAGIFIVAWWLCAIVAGPRAYAIFSMVARHPVGQLVLFAFVWSLAFHLVNGIRHLVWDIGIGFDVRIANRSGIAAIVLSLLLAVAVFGYAYGAKGLHL